MIDDLLADIFREIARERIGASKRAQLLARLFFGLLGTGLCGCGAVYFLLRTDIHNPALRAAMVTVFASLACFSLFNVALARTWRWPGVVFVVSLVSLFAIRVLFGP